MKTLYHHRYELIAKAPLNARSERRVIAGALLRCNDGVGCVQPWPELGEPPLEYHLQELAAGRTTELTARALKCAEVDGAARRVGASLFQHLQIPPSHATCVEMPTLETLAALAAEGFTTAKLKINAAALETMSHWEQVPLRLRLDANAAMSSGDYLQAMLKLRKEVREAIDFVEDPCPHDPVLWIMLKRKTGVPLARDRGLGTGGYAVRVWKPAAMKPFKWGGRLVITSNMDHAIGQMYAAWEAARRRADETCGVLTHGLFEPDAFFATMSSEGPQLHSPSGTGLGFDAQLEALPWKRCV